MERVGQGGMSTVYRARQARMGRDVALKLIIPELAASPGFVERFLREAHILAGLQHPHILPIYDVGIVDDPAICYHPAAQGCAYIVMAYMAGGSLHELSAQYPAGMPLPPVVRLVTQTASAIDALHESNVTHSDVKPANILLDDHANAYVADFGIARVPGDTGGEAPGTYAYAPPEVSEGQPRGQLGDIYSLGVVTFQLLAGEPPYKINNEQAMKLAHQSKRVPDLSAWRPDLPPGVALAVRQAMHREPNSRPRTATAFAEALSQAAGRPRPQEGRIRPPRNPIPLPEPPTTRRHLPPVPTTRPRLAPVPAVVPQVGQAAAMLMLIIGLALLLAATLLSLGRGPQPVLAPAPAPMVDSAHE